MKKKRILLFFLLVLCCITITAQTVRTHIVERGETKESIARKYGVRIDELETANPVAMRNFYVCTELVIPKHVPNAEEIRQEQEFQARLAEEQRAKEQRKAERRSRLANFFGALGQAMVIMGSTSTNNSGYRSYSVPQSNFNNQVNNYQFPIPQFNFNNQNNNYQFPIPDFNFDNPNSNVTGTYSPVVMPSNPNGTSDIGSGVSTNSKTKVWHNCPTCNGTGSYVKNLNPSTFGNDYKKYCSECGQYFMASTGHSHLTCPQCHGKKGYYTE